MGQAVITDMKHYGQWTDEAGLDTAFGAANAKLTTSVTRRQQQMQQGEHLKKKCKLWAPRWLVQGDD